MARAFAEQVQALKTRLSGLDVETRRRENTLAQNERHLLVIHYQKRLSFLFGRGCRRHGWRGCILCFGKSSQFRMVQDFFIGTTSLFDKLRCQLSRAINTRPEHVKILLRPVVAIPDVLDRRVGARNDFQQIVQLARGGSGGLDPGTL